MCSAMCLKCHNSCQQQLKGLSKKSLTLSHFEDCPCEALVVVHDDRGDGHCLVSEADHDDLFQELQAFDSLVAGAQLEAVVVGDDQLGPVDAVALVLEAKKQRERENVENCAISSPLLTCCCC